MALTCLFKRLLNFFMVVSLPIMMLSLLGVVWGNRSLLESDLKCLDTKGRKMSFKKCLF